MRADAPGGDLAPGGEAELGEDVLDVVLRGAFGEHQPLGDLPVRQAFGDQRGHLGLARAQAVRRSRRSAARQCGGAVAYAVMPSDPTRRSASRASGRGAITVAGRVARDQRRGEVELRLGDEPGRPGGLGLPDRHGQVVDRGVQAPEGRGAARPSASSAGPM